MRSRVLAALFLVPAGAVQPAVAREPLPAVVRQAVAEAHGSCPTACFRPRFVTTADFNRDGRLDYILDFSRTRPVEGGFGFDGSRFCGTAGCDLRIFVSIGSGYREAHGDRVRAFRVVMQAGRGDRLAVVLHGSECGRDGTTNCSRTLRYGARGFVPVR